MATVKRIYYGKVIDPNSHRATSVTGYCIDVFNAVMAAMPFAVNFEFIPFATPDGKEAGTYNDLIFQVYNGVKHILIIFLYIFISVLKRC